MVSKKSSPFKQGSIKKNLNLLNISDGLKSIRGMSKNKVVNTFLNFITLCID